MTYKQLEAHTRIALQTMYDVGEATTIANWLLDDYTGKTKQERRLTPEVQIEETILCKIKDGLAQLLQHKPVQYVLGYTYFYGMKFLVNESVLIPRPETEELVNWVVDTYKNNLQPFQVLDVGTGSGCIPVVIKKRLPLAMVTSLDISSVALEIAAENAVINKEEMYLQQMDFLNEAEWTLLGKYNVIVSNPPYIPLQEKLSLGKNVVNWEPGLALFVPDKNPLIFYKKVALFGKTHLQKNGVVFLETHQDYAGAVQELFMEKGYTTELKKDINGNERMVKAIYN